MSVSLVKDKEATNRRPNPYRKITKNYNEPSYNKRRLLENPKCKKQSLNPQKTPLSKIKILENHISGLEMRNKEDRASRRNDQCGEI